MVRIIIVLLVLGSAYLGWNAWKQNQRLEYLRTALAKDGEVPTLVRDIQETAELYAATADRRADENFKGDDPTQYIYRIAAMPEVAIGRVTVNPGSRPKVNSTKGYSDRTYAIDPNDRKSTFRRGNIANFLFKLEEDSKRIKVTEVNLDANGATGRKPKPNEIPEDLWTMSVTVTMREKISTR